MNVPTYIGIPLSDDDSVVDSVITFADEDICRWEKLIASNNSNPLKSIPRVPRRRVSVCRQLPEVQSYCLPSMPKRRGSVVMSTIIQETNWILELDDDDEEEETPDKGEQQQQPETRTSDPPALPQRRETLMLE